MTRPKRNPTIDNEGFLEPDESDSSEDVIQRPTLREFVLDDDRFHEVAVDGTGSRFTADDLGLNQDFTEQKRCKTDTRLRIAQLQDLVVDVANTKGEKLASWRIVKESLADPEMAEEDENCFGDVGLRGVDFDAKNLKFSDIFFNLWPGKPEEEVRLINKRIDSVNTALSRCVTQ